MARFPDQRGGRRPPPRHNGGLHEYRRRDRHRYTSFPRRHSRRGAFRAARLHRRDALAFLEPGHDRSQGVQLATIKELARYWETEYDWRKAEAKLNALPQFTTEIDGVDIHFIHVKSAHENALPLIMTHGWPGSVIELLETVGPLIDPTAHGGRAEDAFHLVLPSCPDTASGEPADLGWNAGRVAMAWAELMRRLGYTRYVAQGGDVVPSSRT